MIVCPHLTTRSLVPENQEAPINSLTECNIPAGYGNKGEFHNTKPLDYEILDTGEHLIRGVAYTGEGSISGVALSFDGGKSWEAAEVQKGMKKRVPGNHGFINGR